MKSYQWYAALAGCLFVIVNLSGTLNAASLDIYNDSDHDCVIYALPANSDSLGEIETDSIKPKRGYRWDNIRNNELYRLCLKYTNSKKIVSYFSPGYYRLSDFAGSQLRISTLDAISPETGAVPVRLTLGNTNGLNEESDGVPAEILQYNWNSTYGLKNGGRVNSTISFVNGNGTYKTNSFTGKFSKVRFYKDGSNIIAKGIWSAGSSSGPFHFRFTGPDFEKFSGEYNMGSYRDYWNGSRQ